MLRLWCSFASLFLTLLSYDICLKTYPITQCINSMQSVVWSDGYTVIRYGQWSICFNSYLCFRMFGYLLLEWLCQTAVTFINLTALYDHNWLCNLYIFDCVWRNRYVLNVSDVLWNVCVSACGSAVCLHHVVCAMLLSSPRVLCGCVKTRWGTCLMKDLNLPHKHAHSHNKHIWSKSLRRSPSASTDHMVAWQPTRGPPWWS